MNYYLRKMKGSLVRLRLLAIPNNEKLSFDEDVEDKKEWVIAHCWGIHPAQ